MRLSHLRQTFKQFSYRQNVRRFTTTNASTNGVPPNEKAIGYWLLGMTGLVAGMVTIGGVTRLTRSGLSMTDWKLSGSLPPMNKDEWTKEFERYKKFPEWQQRQSMTLNEFKFIYFWEYGHRMFGRFLGVAFAVPFSYFAVRGMIPGRLYPRLGLLFSLGGLQGLVGWWMVKSGLEMDPAERKEIRVSPYRLASHLTMAFTTYALLLWTGLDLLNPRSLLEKATSGSWRESWTKQTRNVKSHALLNSALVFTTVISGAYVAGNDAGKAYGDFPLMAGKWIPDGILELNPMWRNFFENSATVQFDHRILALTTLGSIAALYAKMYQTVDGLQGGKVSLLSVLPKRVALGCHASMVVAVGQVALGITTLMLVVPVPLAATHQAGSLVLLTCVTYLGHSLYSLCSLPHVAAAARTNPTAVFASALLSTSSLRSMMSKKLL